LKGIQLTLTIPSDIVFFYGLEFTGGTMENQSISSELFNPDSPPAGNQNAAAITVTLSSGSADVLQDGTLFFLRGTRINTGTGNVGIASAIVSAGSTTISGNTGAPVSMAVGAGTPRIMTVGDASGTPGTTNVLVPVTITNSISNYGVYAYNFTIFNGATVNAGAGVTFSNYDYTNAPNSVTFTANVAPGTALGIRPLTIQNTGSGTANVPGSVDIRYRAPSFASIVPSSAVQGSTLNVIVTGADFFDETLVKTALNMGAGITVNSVTINTFNQLTANISVAGGATVGPRDVTLTNAVSGTSGGSDTELGAFQVLLDGNPIPSITTVTPNSGRQGENVALQIVGTNFSELYTSVSFGPNTTVNSFNVPNSTTINLVLAIGGNAALGARNVTVTNAGPGGGVDVLVNGFTINPPLNTAPVANNDQYQTPFNTVLVVNTPGVLLNDTDDGGLGNLTAQLVTNLNPANAGTLNFSANGAFTFTPTAGYSGVATFTYRAVDSGALQSNIATVSIVVSGAQNSIPVAQDDNFNTAFNTPLNVPAPGVLANDIDDGGVGNLTAQLVNPAPLNVGAVTLNPNGSINYIPAAEYSGTFEFTYRATDVQGAQSNLATVRITVSGTSNAAPTANNDAYAVASGATLTVNAPGILANDTDDGGVGNLTAQLVQTTNMTGSFTLNPNGSFTYTPSPNFFGISTFTYRAVDASNQASNIATVTITVGLAAPTHNANWPAGQNPFVSTSPTLSFNPVLGAQFYEVQVSKSTDFGPDTMFDACYPDCGSVMKLSSAETNTITYQTYNTSVIASGLKGATQYYWRARAAAMNGVVKGAWSDLRSFITVATPNAPVLVGPNNNDVGVPAQALLTWQASTGATSYNVQVSLNSNFDVNIVDANTGALSLTTPALSGGPVFYWRVRAIGIGGESVWSEVRKFTRAALVSIGDDDSGLPTEYVLEQNYPNPFNPSTTISFRLPETADVTLQVFNMHGQMVGTVLQNVTKNAGVHTASFDASKLSSGVYIYRIVAGNFTASQKMVLVK
jgi:hypothetical protein